MVSASAMGDKRDDTMFLKLDKHQIEFPDAHALVLIGRVAGWATLLDG